MSEEIRDRTGDREIATQEWEARAAEALSALIRAEADAAKAELAALEAWEAAGAVRDARADGAEVRPTLARLEEAYRHTRMVADSRAAEARAARHAWAANDMEAVIRRRGMNDEAAAFMESLRQD